MATISLAYSGTAGYRMILSCTINASANNVEVQRTKDGGITAEPVRGTNADDPTLSTVVGTSATVYDSEFDFDEATMWRCRGRNPSTGYVEAWSAWTAPLTIPSTGCQYVVHGVDLPGFFAACEFGEEPGYTQAAPRGVFYRLGIAEPTVVMGQRRAPASTAGFSVLARSHAERAAIEEVLGQDLVMCVRGPKANGWRQKYVVLGDASATHKRPVNAGAWVLRYPWTGVAYPEATPVRSFGATWDSVVSTYLTWTQVIADNASWNTLVGRIL